MPLTINVGVDTDQFDQFLYLPKRFNSTHDEYTVAIHHHDREQKIPRLYNSSYEASTDSIDVHLHPAALATQAIVPLANHVSMQLWEKPTQLSFLHRLRETTKNPELDKFCCQQYVCVIPESGRQQAKRQFTQMQHLGEQFIIRPNLGANGLGVKLISGDLIPKTIHELNSLEWIERIAETQTELEKYASAGFHFCEYVPDATEIRVLRTYDGNLLSSVRGKNATDTSNGLELGRVDGTYSVILRDSIDDLPINCSNITALIEALLPMQKAGSYDFWVTPNGEFGLYEFSTQFALNACDPELRSAFMVRYIESMIEAHTATK